VTVAFRVDEARMLAAAGRLSLWGGLSLAIGIVLFLFGLLLAAYGVLAIAMHTFAAGDTQDIAAGILVMVLCVLPLVTSALLLTAGALCLVRASRLRVLRGLVMGRDSVSTVELVARSGRTEREILTLFSQAERRGAAVRLSASGPLAGAR